MEMYEGVIDLASIDTDTLERELLKRKALSNGLRLEICTARDTITVFTLYASQGSVTVETGDSVLSHRSMTLSDDELYQLKCLVDYATANKPATWA